MDHRATIQNAQKVRKKAENIIHQQKEYALFNKAFLTPIEIVLRESQDRSKLPVGLTQAVKLQISDNKYKPKDFLPFQKDSSKIRQSEIQDCRQSGTNNLLSLMMPGDSRVNGIEIAICVCMYSEDKSMLKRTMRGIFNNIRKFIQTGTASNRIGVFVIMDGIQVVDGSVEQYFEQLQKQDYVFLTDDVQKFDLRDMKQNIKQNEQNENEQNVSNINHIIFEDDEFEDRKMKRFASRKKQYVYNKNMINQIEIMQKNKTITYDDLNPTLQSFFLDIAKEQYKKDYAITDQDFDQIQNKNQILVEAYAQNIATSLPIIRKALNQGKRYCKEYLETRQKLALMSMFRVPIPKMKINKNVQNKQETYIQVQDEETETDQGKTNLFFVTKYKNRGKLSSHNWFFNGFCKELRPKYSVLLDVGLVPDDTALWKMINHMQIDDKIGGVCGYMGLRIERLAEEEQMKENSVDFITEISMKFVDIQRAQQFEYHFAHLVDKPFESAFSFIHVLPGAFSAYRMEAIEKKNNNELMQEYFKSIDQLAATKTYKAYPMSPFQTVLRIVLPQFLYYFCYDSPAQDSYQKLLYDQNVYLAQDRTLCMGIHRNQYDLKFLPDAFAWVDPIKKLDGLLGQRKRWINGSFFAFDKVKETLSQRNSDCLLKIQIFYLTLMNMLGFIAPGLFMFTIHIAMFTFKANVIIPILQGFDFVQDSPQVSAVGVFVYTIDFIYVMMFLGLIFYSMHLTNKQPKFRAFFYGASTAYGVFSISVFGVLLYDIISGFATGKSQFLINNPWFEDSIPGGSTTIESLRFIMLGIIGLYVLPILVFMFSFSRVNHIVDMVFSTFSFIFFSPTYLIILNIYALCRIDDISWGTKGLDSEVSNRKEEMTDEWKKIKIIHVCKFVFYNIVVAFLLLIFGDNYVARFFLTFAIMILIGFTLLLKVVIAVGYLIYYRCTNSKVQKKNNQNNVVKDQIDQNFEYVKDSLYAEIVTANGWGTKGKEKDRVQPTLSLNSSIQSKLNKNNKNGIKKGTYRKNMIANFEQTDSSIQKSIIVHQIKGKKNTQNVGERKGIENKYGNEKYGNEKGTKFQMSQQNERLNKNEQKEMKQLKKQQQGDSSQNLDDTRNNGLLKKQQKNTSNTQKGRHARDRNQRII